MFITFHADPHNLFDRLIHQENIPEQGKDNLIKMLLINILKHTNNICMQNGHESNSSHIVGPQAQTGEEIVYSP